MQAFHAQFLSHFKQGVMKPNRYLIQFQLPRGVDFDSPSYNVTPGGIDTESLASENMSLNGRGGINIKCHTAMFPQRTIQTSELKQNTNPYRVPNSVIYDPVTFSFYADAAGDTRVFFDRWQQTAVNVSNHTMNFYKEFVRDVKMYTLDESGRPRYGIKLVEAYPLSVGAMDISYSQANNYQNVVCTMAYRYWEEIPVTGQVFLGDVEKMF